MCSFNHLIFCGKSSYMLAILPTGRRFSILIFLFLTLVHTRNRHAHSLASCGHIISFCPFLSQPDRKGSASSLSSSPLLLLFLPLLSSPPPPSPFLRLCLIYPFLSDKVSGDERHLLRVLWRCIALLNYVGVPRSRLHSVAWRVHR